MSSPSSAVFLSYASEDAGTTPNGEAEGPGTGAKLEPRAHTVLQRKRHEPAGVSPLILPVRARIWVDSRAYNLLKGSFLLCVVGG
jgi:hypothetical protein